MVASANVPRNLSTLQLDRLSVGKESKQTLGLTQLGGSIWRNFNVPRNLYFFKKTNPVDNVPRNLSTLQLQRVKANS